MFPKRWRLVTKDDILNHVPGARHVIDTGPGRVVVKLGWWNWLVPGRIAVVKELLHRDTPVGVDFKIHPCFW